MKREKKPKDHRLLKGTKPKAKAAPRAPRPGQSGNLIQTMIGDKLKAAFDQVANEPIPDKFIELLRQLEAKENRKK